MFLGEYNHSVDSKGRIIIPSKFRDNLGKKFVITKGLDNCLFIYTTEEWSILEDKIKTLPITDSGVRRFVRFFFGGACEVELDGQGRAILQQNLRDYANITKEILSIGVSNRIEIWSKENWTTYNETVNFVDDDLGKRMVELGF